MGRWARNKRRRTKTKDWRLEKRARAGSGARQRALEEEVSKNASSTVALLTPPLLFLPAFRILKSFLTRRTISPAIVEISLHRGNKEAWLAATFAVCLFLSPLPRPTRGGRASVFFRAKSSPSPRLPLLRISGSLDRKR